MNKAELIAQMAAKAGLSKADAEKALRNPQTGETVQIPASVAPTFKAGKALKDKVNAQFWIGNKLKVYKEENLKTSFPLFAFL